ncbi:unnamed protein product [Somion occarium]|uniref:Protein kinase domain-containing protein n=1 Tax=Somion occarium TaxID=3059160 RepID=A0ABP1DWC8_9APHY
MPFSVKVTTTVASTAIVLSTVIYYCVLSGGRSSPPSQPKDSSSLRQKLPVKLSDWRNPGDVPECEAIWESLDQVLRNHGLEQWAHTEIQFLKSPQNSYPLATGFAYVIPSRMLDSGPGTAKKLTWFQYINPVLRMARTKDGHDVAIRVITVNKDGHEQLNILRKVAASPSSLLSNNHTLPMLRVFEYEDITFGIFPRTAGCMEEAFDSWPKNSVGDVLNMILQALEGLAFIHDLGIAHRDADKSNFLVQWHPESLRTMTVAISRPRVYLIDFEVAVEFPSELPIEARVSIGPPSGGTINIADGWGRAVPPEVDSGMPYSPFKLDVWQLGYSFITFRSTVPAIDEVLAELVLDDPVARPNASEALTKLGKVVNGIPPEALLIEPVKFDIEPKQYSTEPHNA